MPPHFTLQRGSVVIRHTDPLEIHEVIDLREGVSNLNLLLNNHAFTVTLVG